MNDWKKTSTWYSERLGREITVARWGNFGTPVIVFPTAGGDAEEIERFKMIHVLGDLMEAGKVKIYSCDSINGRALLTQEGSTHHRGWILHQFLEFIRHEMVPLIHHDCGGELAVITSGPSIGAYNALACVCRYPETFSHAICLSGTFDLTRWVDNHVTREFYHSSPLHFVPNMNGEDLTQLRERFVLLASGEGDYENIGESWLIAKVLGSAGVPNRVDSWGTEWHHDWSTWREMLPKYLSELTS